MTTATMLVDATRQAAAVRLAHWTLPGFFLGALCEAVALAYFWGSGGAAAARDRLRRRFTSAFAIRFSFGALLAAIARLAALPAAFYLYRVERIMGLTAELTRWWGLAYIAHTLLATIVAGMIAAVILWLVDRTHQWYLYAILVIFVASLSWALAEPYVELVGARYRPPPISLAQNFHELAVRAGHPEVAVLVRAGRAGQSEGAVVPGVGGLRRIVISRGLLDEGMDDARYAVAFQLGHIVHGDNFSIALVEAAIIVVGAALSVVIADRIGFRRDDDPLSRLALVGALLAIVYIVAVPVRNVALRSEDAYADRFAVALTNDKAGTVNAIVHETNRRLDEVCPEMLATVFITTRPAPGEVIAHIAGIPSGCP